MSGMMFTQQAALEMMLTAFALEEAQGSATTMIY
jgi:hypothetical protein